jgi:hypothetical protein
LHRSTLSSSAGSHDGPDHYVAEEPEGNTWGVKHVGQSRLANGLFPQVKHLDGLHPFSVSCHVFTCSRKHNGHIAFLNQILELQGIAGSVSVRILVLSRFDGEQHGEQHGERHVLTLNIPGIVTAHFIDDWFTTGVTQADVAALVSL